MRLRDISVGMACRVRFGGAERPAMVEAILSNGKVGVRFMDVSADTARGIPATHRGNLFGAVVRPQYITRA